MLKKEENAHCPGEDLAGVRTEEPPALIENLPIDYY